MSNFVNANLASGLRRFLAGAVLLCSAAIAGMMLPGASALAQEKGSIPDAAGNTVTTTTTTYKGWSVVCTESGQDKPKNCTATFRVLNQQNRTDILVWVFGVNASGEPLTEIFTLTDVMIKPGVQIKLGDADPITAEFVFCRSNGCKASLALDADTIEQMKAAKSARMDITRTDGKVIQFTMEIPGIDLALSDIGF